MEQNVFRKEKVTFPLFKWRHGGIHKWQRFGPLLKHCIFTWLYIVMLPKGLYLIWTIVFKLYLASDICSFFVNWNNHSNYVLVLLWPADWISSWFWKLKMFIHSQKGWRVGWLFLLEVHQGSDQKEVSSSCRKFHSQAFSSTETQFPSVTHVRSVNHTIVSFNFRSSLNIKAWNWPTTVMWFPSVMIWYVRLKMDIGWM